MAAHADDPEDTEVWRHVLEQLRAGGASRAEALDGANLILAAYLRGRRTLAEGMHAAAADEEPGG
jgi:hypothetical protein